MRPQPPGVVAGEDMVGSRHRSEEGSYLWFGTFFGLNRYDGTSFTTFHHDPLDSTTLAEDSISDLLEDRDGTLWVATWGSGIDRFDPRSETFFHYPSEPHGSGLQDGRVQVLHQDRSGTSWPTPRTNLKI